MVSRLLKDRFELWLRLYGAVDKVGWWRVRSYDRLVYLIELMEIDYIIGDFIRFEYDYDNAWSLDWSVTDVIDEMNIIMLTKGLTTLPSFKNVSDIEYLDMMLALADYGYDCQRQSRQDVIIKRTTR